MTGSCEHTRERLSDRLDHLADGGAGVSAMDATELGRVEAHLAECESCRAIAEALDEARGWCADLDGVAAPAGFAASVGEAIRQTPQEAAPPRRLRGPGPIFATMGLAAGVLALAVIVDRTRSADSFVAAPGGAVGSEVAKTAERAAKKIDRAPESRATGSDFEDDAETAGTRKRTSLGRAQAPGEKKTLDDESKHEAEDSALKDKNSDGRGRRAAPAQDSPAEGGERAEPGAEADDDGEAMAARMRALRETQERLDQKSKQPKGRAEDPGVLDELEKGMAEADDERDAEELARELGGRRYRDPAPEEEQNQKQATAPTRVVYLVARVAPDGAEARKLRSYLATYGQPEPEVRRRAGFAGDNADDPQADGGKLEAEERAADRESHGRPAGTGDPVRGSTVEAILPEAAWKRLSGPVLQTWGMGELVSVQQPAERQLEVARRNARPRGPVPGGLGTPAPTPTGPTPDPAESAPSAPSTPTTPSGPTGGPATGGPTAPSAPAPNKSEEGTRAKGGAGRTSPGTPTGPAGPASGPSGPAGPSATPTSPGAPSGPSGPAAPGTAPSKPAAPADGADPKPAAPSAPGRGGWGAGTGGTPATAGSKTAPALVRVILVFEPPVTPPAAEPKSDDR